jgi:hypothetical protein
MPEAYLTTILQQTTLQQTKTEILTPRTHIHSNNGNVGEKLTNKQTAPIIYYRNAVLHIILI